MAEEIPAEQVLTVDIASARRMGIYPLPGLSEPVLTAPQTATKQGAKTGNPCRTFARLIKSGCYEETLTRIHSPIRRGDARGVQPELKAVANGGTSNPATQTAMPKQATPDATPDVMTAELAKLAGADARDCGRIAMSGDVQSASQCAMQANDAKKPFYVRYDLPMPDAQMAIATVRTPDGKLMSVQYDSKGWEKPVEGAKLNDAKTVAVGPCPTPNNLRIASSGRVTCFAPTQMPAGMSPHGGGAQMPPGMGMPPAGTANPHKGAAPTKSH